MSRMTGGMSAKAQVLARIRGRQQQQFPPAGAATGKQLQIVRSALLRARVFAQVERGAGMSAGQRRVLMADLAEVRRLVDQVEDQLA